MGYSSALSIAVRTRRAYVGDRAIVERRERIPRYAQVNLPTAGNMSFDVAGVTDQDDLAFRNNANAAWVLLRAIFGPINADYVVGTANAILTNELVLGTAVIMAGTLAARPVASLEGRLYAATDTLEVYRDTGAAWVLIATAGGLVSTSLRQVTLNWQSLDNVFTRLGGGGAATLGGTGQVRLRVADNAVDTGGVENQTDAVGAQDSSMAAANNPYLAIYVAADAFRANARMVFGVRAVLGGALPTIENHAAFLWNGANFRTSTGNGAVQNVNNVATPGVGAWHILEIRLLVASAVFTVDGAVVQTHVANLPAGSLDWQLLLFSDGSGGATTSNVTCGRGVVQETRP